MNEEEKEDGQPGDSEIPLVILKRNYTWWFNCVLLLAVLVLYSIFGVILPVLKTGDYTSIWPSGYRRSMNRNIIHYYLSWFIVLMLPFWTVVFKAGICYFYNDRLEVKPFWGRRKIIITYKQMHVLLYENRALFITAQSVPSWAHPLQRYKVQCWNGIRIGIIYRDAKIAGLKMGLTRGWENPDDIPKAVQILRERAFSFNEKRPII